MKKIDTSGWKEFRVGELFDAKRGRSMHLQQIPEGSTPVIAAGGYNQGIAGFYDIEADYENAITISCNGVGCGSTFYHNYPFTVNGDAIALTEKCKMSGCAKIFIANVYNSYFSNIYSYAEKCSANKALGSMIPLPATPSGDPDWEYMEKYMAKIMKESEVCLENLRSADEKKTAVDVSKWKEFEIGKLFDIVKGTRLTKANMKEGSNRFIGSSALNNGLTALIANDEKMHPANTLTVCYNGSVGETFYQNKPFWASDDVNVLYPKFAMTKNIGLFIVPLIRSAGQQYAFVDKWRMDVMSKDYIKLPVNPYGEPDWAYMEFYISRVMQGSASCLNSLALAIAD